MAVLTVIAFSGCRKSHDFGQMTNIESILNSAPKDALDSLNSINYESLTEAEKHYYDFLRVKVNDKNYIEHESDSLIMQVVEYQSRHKRNGRYPESLYYAGRVYSDLGDYPRALSYYQQALDAIKEKNADEEFMSIVSSQYGWLLTQMNLYEESMPYVKTSLNISKTKKDTVNIINDLQLLGGVLLKLKKYGESERAFKDAMSLAKNKYPYHYAKSRMYMASIKYNTDQLDSAVLYIENVAENVHPVTRNHALYYAANIYLQADSRDSAYKYARELIAADDSLANEIGYDILLDSSLSGYIAPDSLRFYINNYHELLSARFDKNSTSLAINRQNMYNYQTHVHEKEKTEKNNRLLKTFIMWLLLLFFVMAYIIMFIRSKNKTKIIQLQQALANIQTLKSEIESNHSIKFNRKNNSINLGEDDCKTSTNIKTDIKRENIPTEKELRLKLQKELMQIYKKAKGDVFVSHHILQSDVYRQLLEMAEKGEMIVDSDPLWDEVENVVMEASPQFKNNLFLLASGKLSIPEIHTALLIKCGIRPVDMKNLLGKSNGAIISRRDSLCVKVLDKKVEAKVITNIIRLL